MTSTKSKQQMVAAIYARYSSDNQKESSVEDQITEALEEAKRSGYIVPPALIFSDKAKSGTSREDRDGWEGLLDAIRHRKFDVLLFESQSRLNRDVEDFAYLSKRLSTANISMHSLHDGVTQPGDMMSYFRSVMDQHMVETLRKNVRRGLRGKARDGFRPTGLTYGYRRKEAGAAGEWEIEPTKADVVRRVFREYVSGISVRDIARGLTRDGIPAPKDRGGAGWKHQAILGGGDTGGVISNPLYIGMSIWGKLDVRKDHDTKKTIKRWRPESEWIKTEVPHLRIIDQALWEAAQKVRASRQNVKVEGETVRRVTITRDKKQLLSGMLYCGVCHSKMVMCSQSRGKKYVACGAAHMRSACEHTRSYAMDGLKKLVIENLNMPDDPEFIEREKRAYNLQFAKATQDGNKGERDALEKQIAKIKAQKSRLVDLIADGELELDAQELKAKIKAKDIEQAGLAERLRLFSDKVLPMPNAFDAYRRNVALVHRKLVEEADSDEARLAFQTVMDRIVVTPVPVGTPYKVVAYGRLGSGTSNLFPAARSIEKIVESEGLSLHQYSQEGFTLLASTDADDGSNVIRLGQWTAAA